SDGCSPSQSFSLQAPDYRDAVDDRSLLQPANIVAARVWNQLRHLVRSPHLRGSKPWTLHLGLAEGGSGHRSDMTRVNELAFDTGGDRNYRIHRHFHNTEGIVPLSPLEVLKKVPLFATMREGDITAFAELVRERSYPKGSVIVFEDDPG